MGGSGLSSGKEQVTKGVLTPDLERKASLRAIEISDSPVWWAKRHYVVDGFSDGKWDSLFAAVGCSFYYLPYDLTIK